MDRLPKELSEAQHPAVIRTLYHLQNLGNIHITFTTTASGSVAIPTPPRNGKPGVNRRCRNEEYRRCETFCHESCIYTYAISNAKITRVLQKENNSYIFALIQYEDYHIDDFIVVGA